MDRKVIATNKKALRDYQIFEKYEAGVVLKGSEVKSLREGKCSLDGSFARIENGEVIAYNIHIPEFEKSSIFKHDPKREKKLLLKKREIRRLTGLLTQRGFTLIPLKIYFNNRGWAKVELGLCRGRKKIEKKKREKERDIERQAQKEISKFWRRNF